MRWPSGEDMALASMTIGRETFMTYSKKTKKTSNSSETEVLQRLTADSRALSFPTRFRLDARERLFNEIEDPEL